MASEADDDSHHHDAQRLQDSSCTGIGILDGRIECRLAHEKAKDRITEKQNDITAYLQHFLHRTVMRSGHEHQNQAAANEADAGNPERINGVMVEQILAGSTGQPSDDGTAASTEIAPQVMTLWHDGIPPVMYSLHCNMLYHGNTAGIFYRMYICFS